jgi:hypothetical protein
MIDVQKPRAQLKIQPQPQPRIQLLSEEVRQLHVRSPAIQDVLPARHPKYEHKVAPTQQLSAQPDTPRSPMTQLKRRTFAPPKTKEAVRRQRLLRLEKYMLLAATPAVIIVTVRLSATPLLGEIAIGVYGLCALIWRIPGRVSFWLASMALVSIGIEFLLFPQTNRPNNTALFVFLLLAVGFVSMALETRRLDVHGKRLRRR